MSDGKRPHSVSSRPSSEKHETTEATSTKPTVVGSIDEVRQLFSGLPNPFFLVSDFLQRLNASADQNVTQFKNRYSPQRKRGNRCQNPPHSCCRLVSISKRALLSSRTTRTWTSR